MSFNTRILDGPGRCVERICYDTRAFTLVANCKSLSARDNADIYIYIYIFAYVHTYDIMNSLLFSSQDIYVYRFCIKMWGDAISMTWTKLELWL